VIWSHWFLSHGELHLWHVSPLFLYTFISQLLISHRHMSLRSIILWMISITMYFCTAMERSTLEEVSLWRALVPCFCSCCCLVSCLVNGMGDAPMYPHLSLLWGAVTPPRSSDTECFTDRELSLALATSL